MSLATLGYIATKQRLAGTRWLGVGVLAALHLAAITVAAWTEYDWVGPAIFMLAWALLNAGDAAGADAPIPTPSPSCFRFSPIFASWQ